MANKQINELTEKSDVLVDDDLIVVYDSDEAGSEKAKKVAISNYVAAINSQTTLYVTTGGSDATGDGTVGNPFATPNGAYNWLKNKYITSQVTIDIADGTYSNLDTLIIQHACSRYILFEGNTSNPENVVLSYASDQTYCMYSDYTSNLRLQGVRIVGTNTGTNYGIGTFRCSVVRLENVQFRGEFTYACYAANSSYLRYSDSDIDGSGGNITTGIRATDGSCVFANGTVTIKNTTTAMTANSGSFIRRLGTEDFSGNTTDYSPAWNTTGNRLSMIST